MAGYYKLYVIGGLGGFLGTDGVNPIYMQILVGTSSREWREPRYFAEEIAPMGKLRCIVPQGPDDPDALLDASLAFFPAFFEGCPSLAKASEEFGATERLDFDADGIPALWKELREEARARFGELNVWEAELNELHPRSLDDLRAAEEQA